MFVAGLVMMFKNPELLKKRLNAKEEEKEQKAVIAFSGIMFLAAFIVAGLNFRFQWLVLPKWAVAIGTVVFLLAYAMYAEGNRYRAVRNRPPPDVLGYAVPVFVHGNHSRLTGFLRDSALLYSHYRDADEK